MCFNYKKRNTVILCSSSMISIGAIVVGCLRWTYVKGFPCYYYAGGVTCAISSTIMISERLGCTNCTEPLEYRDCSRLCYNRDAVIAVTAAETVGVVTTEAEWHSNVTVADAEWHGNVYTITES